MKNGMTYIQLLNETLHCYASKGSLEAYTYIMEHAKGIVGMRLKYIILNMH